MKALDTMDFELNHRALHGTPTLVPTPALEQQLNLKLQFPLPHPAGATAPLPRYAIHIHGYYLEELEALLNQLQSRASGCDLFITTDTNEKRNSIEQLMAQQQLASSFSSIQVQCTPNTGRNVGPLLLHVCPQLSSYEVALHLHTKRSSHNTIGKAWFNDLVDCLMGSVDQVLAIRRAFHHHPTLGLLMPRPGAAIRPFVNWGDNLAIAQQICQTSFPARELTLTAPLVFAPGMMFWFRPHALQGLERACRALAPLPAEPLAVDGTPLHALERLVAHACEAEGYRWALCSPEREWTALEGCQPQTLSVWDPHTAAYLQATASLAAALRQSEQEREALDLRLHAHIADLDRQLHDVRSSLSWRLTAPLRNLRR